MSSDSPVGDPPSSEPQGAVPAAPLIPHRPTIEIGWVISDRMDAPDREAVERARQRLEERLAQRFQEVEWRLPSKRREVPQGSPRASIVALLDVGAAELESMHWDLAFVFTDEDLDSYYRAYCFAAPSSTLSVAVLSTNRLDPRAGGDRGPLEERVGALSQRVYALAGHMLGELLGLEHSEHPSDLMYELQEAEDLDRMASYSEESIESLRSVLGRIADQRLEERRRSSRWSALGFYLRAVWHERGTILKAVRQARPWQFPARFSRLSTAAFSTLLVLAITAEAWDLGMSQSPRLVAALSLAAIVSVSVFLFYRQQLLGRRSLGSRGELQVVAQVSVALSVLAGMVTTYVLLFFSLLLIGQLFFGPTLVEQWAASIEAPIGWRHRLVFAGFVASLGILLSALGASFEEQSYFRHVALVDEET